MSNGGDSWDNSGMSPDLTRLPQHVREGMTTPVPIRPDECHTAFMIFKQSPGLNHPNARCNVVPFRRQGAVGISIDLGVQVDFTEFSGRLPLATAVMAKSGMRVFITGLLRAYHSVGGDVDELYQAAKLPRKVENSVAFFEERNDK